jgi:addiction module RelE/StbE family toxin
MHRIEYTKPFLKQYKKLSPSVQRKTKEAIKKFEIEPKDQSLRAHKLSGRLSKFYSLSVDHSYRIVFEIDKLSGKIFLLKVGGHEIYK